MTRREMTALDKTMRRAVVEWGAEGWALTGPASKLRVSVFVRKRVEQTDAAISTVRLPASLGGVHLKVSVMAMHGAAATVQSATPNRLPPGAGIDYVAPGAPIGGDGERIGIGAVFAIDGEPHIVTCGHPFTSDDAVITTLDQTEIGTLRSDCNFFRSPNGLDAAVFEVNEDGLELLNAGAVASTWSSAIHEPDADDNHEDAAFWPTWTDGAQPFVESVVSYSSCTVPTAACGDILLARCTTEGDSGSTLQLGGEYYGLASRRDGNFSFFTPLSAVKRRLKGAVTPWRPA